MSGPPATGTPVDAARRFAARARRRRLAAVRPVVVAVAVLVLIGAGAYLVLGTSVFGVRRVVVVGTHRLASSAVLAAAKVSAHHPLATLDVGAIERRVEALAPVDRVQVARQWRGTVRIEVTERTPVALARDAHDGGYELVDPTGVPFWHVAARPSGLPLLDLRTPKPGDPATRAALAVLAALPAKVRARVEAVRAPSPAAVELSLAGGRTVVWGTAADGARKAAVLAALLRRPGHVYDVSTPGVATIR